MPGKTCFRGVIQAAQKRSLPAVPHAGPDGANIRNGEQQQQPQPFRRADLRGEVFNGFGVLYVPFLRKVAHEQMVLDEPCGGVGLLHRNAEPLGNALGEFCARDGMVLFASLGDVMQEDGKRQRRTIAIAMHEA